MKEKETDLKTAAKIPGDERKNIQRQRNAFAEADTRNCLSKIYVRRRVSPMEAFTTILRQKMIFFSYYIEDQPQIEPKSFGTSGQRTSSKRRYYPSVFELCKILP